MYLRFPIACLNASQKSKNDTLIASSNITKQRDLLFIWPRRILSNMRFAEDK